ncbi:F-box protein PP2-B5 [Sesamum indicum]|uniref:F-box protein PP2-B5 n=1 Tax=Sesamum indicum TaxID=4182 RepID=A0A6I9U1W4_SESIN|nr:F-box protein PP2-B5 [Sesamum indicum]
MAKNYDNWERLVHAVLRGDDPDRETASSHSRDLSSTIISPSSTWDVSFSHEQSIADGLGRQLPMDYSGLTLDHSEWKTMLPPDKQEVAWRSASLSYFLDPSSGKNCFTLGAARLVFSSERWDMISHPSSRFSEVSALPTHSRRTVKFDIRGRIKTQMLSPNTPYAAYLVFELAHNNDTKLHFAYTTIRLVRGDPSDSNHSKRREHRIVSFERPTSCRADEWMEIQLGCFYIDEGGKGEVEVRIVELARDKMDGLIVEGIEFRPILDKV